MYYLDTRALCFSTLNFRFTIFLFALFMSVIGCDDTRRTTSNTINTDNSPLALTITDLKTDKVSISWQAPKSASADDTYEVYLDDNLVAETEETEYSITQLKPHTAYKISVRAIDSSTSKPKLASDVSFTTHKPSLTNRALAPTDTQAPTIPTNLRTTNVGSTHVTLYWNPSIDTTGVVSAYRVYQNDIQVQTVASAQAQITGLQPSQTYLFRVSAVDNAGNISILSPALSVRTSPALSISTSHGADVYAQACANCHGLDGLGVGTTVGVTRPLSVAELTTITETTMPPADPTSCIGDCAASVAQYIFDTFIAAAPIPTDPLANFPNAESLRAEICARAAAANRADAVTDLFCQAAAPTITSLTDLRTRLGLAFTNPAPGRNNNGANGNPSFAITGHSSSLVAHEVNAINPRAIVFTANRGARRGGAAPAGFIATGFVRGDQLVELVAADRNSSVLNFYLVRFQNPCNATNTCTQGDLLSPAVETNWSNVTLFDEVNLSNTVLDCLQCHQTGGPATPKILLMQELANPWAHWLRNNTASSVLIDDFRAARGTNEVYAGIPANMIASSDPRLLENLVRGSGSPQRNQFNSRVIQNEVRASSPGQPADNTVPGVSATWDTINARTIAGQAIAVPYHDIKVTDPALLPQLIQAYQSFQAGTLSASALPNLRDAFYTAQLRDIGFRVAAGLDGQGILRQACTQCHNSNLNQTITRARFNVDLNAMSDTQGGILTGANRDAEIGTTIVRLKLPVEDVRLMPPKLFRKLDAAEIDLAVRYLCSQTTTVISQCAGL